MVSEARREAARQNGLKSRGPKTAQGKSISRCNAMTHGLTARVTMLPNEDPAAYEAQRAGWIKKARPRDVVELSQVERLAYVSLQLQRVARAQSAQLCFQFVAAAEAKRAREQGEAIDLSLRLFRPTWEFRWGGSEGSKPEAETTGSARVAEETVHPALLGSQLEKLGDGCRFLLQEWKGLGAVLDQGQPWQATHCFKAIRLLGMHPASILDVPELAEILRTCQALAGEGSELASETWKLLAPADAERGLLQLLAQLPNAPGPLDAAAARRELSALVKEQLERLAAMVETHDEIAQCEEALAPHRSAFDASAEAERMRRYELALQRVYNRITNELFPKGAARGADRGAAGNNGYRRPDAGRLGLGGARSAAFNTTFPSGGIVGREAIANDDQRSKSDSSPALGDAMPARASEIRRNEPEEDSDVDCEELVEAGANRRNEPSADCGIDCEEFAEAGENRRNEPSADCGTGCEEFAEAGANRRNEPSGAGEAESTRGASSGAEAVGPGSPAVPVEVIRRHQVGCATVTRLSQAVGGPETRRTSRRERRARLRAMKRSER